jgi:hypothetical protein
MRYRRQVRALPHTRVAPSKRNSDAALMPGSRWCLEAPASRVEGSEGLRTQLTSDRRGSSPTSKTNSRPSSVLLRKEVIQPHLPVRLPCYDFTPIADPTFDGSLPRVGPPASGVTNFRGVTGGVYKARERIHRSNADLRLLATPTSRSRVADCDPN